MAEGTFRVEVAREEDLPVMMAICNAAFASMESERALGNLDTPEGRKASVQRRIHAWREHTKVSAQPCAIKCLHTDPTGKETIVASAEWFIYDKPRSEEQYRQEHYLLSAAWVSGPQQEEARERLKPVVDARMRWMGGRAHAVLMYMCVDPSWRRRGVSTMCMHWGLERCEKLSVPAYLEATDEGKQVYSRLGFVEVEQVPLRSDGEEILMPVMVWWPPGTSEEAKKPALYVGHQLERLRDESSVPE